MRHSPHHSTTRSLIIALALFAAVIRPHPASAAEPLQIRGDSTSPPYEFFDDNGEPTGYVVDIARAVTTVMGLDAEIRLDSWDTIRRQLERGEIDIITGMNYSAERDTLVDFSRPHTIIYQAIFVRKDSDIESTDDLAGRSVIVVKGDIMHDYVTKHDLTGNLTIVDSTEEGLRLLAAGNGDSFLGARLPGLYLARKYHLTNIVTVGENLEPQQSCFAVREGDDELLAKLNEGLTIIRHTGRQQEIHDAWFGPFEARVSPVKVLWVVVPAAGVFTALALWLWALRRQVASRTASLRHELQERHRAEHLLRIQRDLARRLININDLASAYRESVDFSLEETDFTSGGSYIVNYADDAMVLVYHKGLSGDFLEHVTRFPLSSEQARLLLRGEPVYADTTSLTGRLGELPPDSAYSAIAILPIKDEETVMAGLIFASDTHDDIDEFHRQIFTLIVQETEASIPRIKARALLLESEEKYRTLFDTSRDALGLADPDGTILDVNRAWLDLFDYEREKIVGRNVSLIYVDPDDRTPLNEAIAREGFIRDFEVPMRTSTGEELICLVSATARYDARGGIAYYQTITHDITERRRLESQLLQAQKLESVARLAGGVAHDFNNMLTAIIGYTELLLKSAHFGTPEREDLQEILSTAHRAADLTSSLLAFSRKQIIMPRLMDLNETILTLDSMLRRLIGAQVELVILPAGDLWLVNADPTQVTQLMTNIILNASDAISGTGKITVTTGNRTIDEHDAPEHPDCAPGDYAVIVISDTGSGMDEATLQHIFEPFFTTKEQGKGTGLGLSTCYGIVRQNNGCIHAESTPGHGSTFTILLPRATSGSPDLPAMETVRELYGGTERILVVEDEDLVRTMTVRTLRDRGYSVMEASNGEEALRLVEGYHDGGPDLLLTDIVMPRLGGVELYRTLSDVTEKPCGVLYMSGYTDSTVIGMDTTDRNINFIQKPFTQSQLLSAVRAALDRTR